MPRQQQSHALGCAAASWLAAWLFTCLTPRPLLAAPSPPLQVTIISRHPADEVLVMASDGLWDVMSNQEAVTLAKKCLGRARSRGSTRQVSTQRTQQAARGSGQQHYPRSPGQPATGHLEASGRLTDWLWCCPAHARQLWLGASRHRPAACSDLPLPPCALCLPAALQSAARVAATVLTRAAVDRGSRDNVTVVIVDLSPMTAAEVEAEAQLSEVGGLAAGGQACGWAGDQAVGRLAGRQCGLRLAPLGIMATPPTNIRSCCVGMPVVAAAALRLDSACSFHVCLPCLCCSALRQ
jgi:hypothetical protein